MSTLKLEHIAHIDNAGPDISIDSSGHLNIVNGNLQMGGVTMLDASNGDLSTGNNASFNIRDAAGEVAGRIRNWSSPTNSIAIESDPSNSAAGSYLTFTVDGAQKMTILGNNVGIGTTSPSAPLTIGSGATRRGSYSDLLIAPGGDNAQIEMWGANTSFAISHFDNDRLGIYSNVSGSWNESRGITIKADGNVGIGTNSPGTSMHLFNGTQARFAMQSSSRRFDLMADGDGFTIRDQSAAVNRFNIDTSGNVGIGTTDPDNYYARDLVVNAADEGGITIVNDTSHQGYLMFADGTSGAETYRGYIGYDHAIDHLQITSGGIVKFLVNNNQEKMSITTSGVIQGASDAEIKTSPIRKHSNTISTNTTIDSSENAIASGPISVATGVTLTINGNMTVV